MKEGDKHEISNKQKIASIYTERKVANNIEKIYKGV